MSRSRGGLVAHNGRFLSEDIQEIDGLRVFALDRVIADLLCLLPWRGRARDALAVLDQALRHAGAAHETFRKAVAARLEQRPDNRGTVRARGLLDLGSERAESPPESWLRLVLIEHGFPLPEVNWAITTPDGRELARLDLAWPGLRICVEYDGWETHAGREAAGRRPRRRAAPSRLDRHPGGRRGSAQHRGDAQRPAGRVRQAGLHVVRRQTDLLLGRLRSAAT